MRALKHDTWEETERAMRVKRVDRRGYEGDWRIGSNVALADRE